MSGCKEEMNIANYENLKIKYMLSAVSEALKLCDDFGCEMEKRLKQLKQITNVLRIEQMQLEMQQYSICSDSDMVWDLIDRLNVLVFQTIQKLNSLSSRVIGSAYNDEMSRQDYVMKRLDEGVHGITARSVGNAVFFRVPILGTRKKMQSSSQLNNPFAKQNSSVFVKGLNRAFENLIETTDIDLTLYSRKTIAFFFVSNQGINSPDNDNYNTGAVINAVAGKTYGGDSPDCCRIVLDSICDTRLPVGTYIALLPYESPFPTKAEIADYWINNPPASYDDASLETLIETSKTAQI